jgi:ribose transport system permease protein
MDERGDLGAAQRRMSSHRSPHRPIEEDAASAHAGGIRPTPPTPARSAGAEARDRRRFKLLRAPLLLLNLGPALAVLALAVLFSLISPIFRSTANLSDIGIEAAPIAVLAMGQLFVIMTRGIDVSVGSVVSLAAVVGVIVYQQVAHSALLAIAVMIGTGLAVGLSNGLIVTRLRTTHPVIITLGSLYVVGGLALVVSKGNSYVGLPSLVTDAGTGYVGGGQLPWAVVITVVLLGIAAVFLHRTRWGRWIAALGGNPEAAERVGLPTAKILTSVYVLSGVGAGIAAILVTGRADAGYPTAGVLRELDAIAAVVIGGASPLGGRGNVGNVVVGAILIAVIHNGLAIVGVSPNWQQVAIGAALIAAVCLDAIRLKFEARVRLMRAQRVEAAPADAAVSGGAA